MATVATILNRAVRLLGALPSGSSLGTNEMADALIAINAMLEAWRNDKLMCYALQEETLTLANGTASYTIGPSGSLNTTRPVTIEAAWILDNGVSYDVRRIEEADYDALAVKTTSGVWPDRFLYRPTMPTGSLIVYPVPNASRTMKLVTRVPVLAFSASSDTVTLPPGWENALAFNLAIDLAPEYSTTASQEVVDRARIYKAAVKTINGRPLKRSMGLAELAGRSATWDITNYPAR